jgi:CheY-like chemotaxis protein
VKRSPSLRIKRVLQSQVADAHRMHATCLRAAPGNGEPEILRAGGMIQPKLLVIDDQQTILTLVRKLAEEVGYRVETTRDPTDFKKLVRSFAPDLILMDVIMPEEDGLELVRFLAAERVHTSVILMSGFDPGLLTVVERMGLALGVKIIRAVQKPLETKGWRDLLAGKR